MDPSRARELLAAERTRLAALLRDLSGDQPDGSPEPGDQADAGERLRDIGEEEAIEETIKERWEALLRAEARLASGTYGISITSGQPIPDERLEADPLAELTVAEAEASEA